MFKCAKINFSKLSLRREFKTLRKFSFACFKLLDSIPPKFDSKALQHEVLLLFYLNETYYYSYDLPYFFALVKMTRRTNLNSMVFIQEIIYLK